MPADVALGSLATPDSSPEIPAPGGDGSEADVEYLLRTPISSISTMEGVAGGQALLPLGEELKQRVHQSEMKRRAAAMMPYLDERVQKMVEDKVEVNVYESWEELDEEIREEVAQEWIDQHFPDYMEGAMEFYLEDRKEQIIDELKADLKADEGFAREVFEDWASRQNLPDEAMREMLEGVYSSGGAILKDSVELDNGEEFRLTDAQRLDFDGFYEDRIDSQAQRLLEDAVESEEPPDHVVEGAMSDTRDAWYHLSDRDKFDYANIDSKVEIKIPGEWKVIHDGDDYNYTRAIVRALQTNLTVEIAAARGIQLSEDASREISSAIWDSWKGASTGNYGMLLQYAAAKELGGHFRASPDGEDDKIIRRMAEILAVKHVQRDKYEEMDEQQRVDAGMTIARSHVYATWLSAQYAMQKAEVERVPLYRAVILDKKLVDAEPRQDSGDYVKLPQLRLLRNGAASTAAGDHGRQVSNSWRGVDVMPLREGAERVVLRIDAPRESYLSVPAFGRNVQDEREVVILGTHWDRWDAWLGKAPSFEEVPFSDEGH